jgi:hypothetical protein
MNTASNAVTESMPHTAIATAIFSPSVHCPVADKKCPFADNYKLAIEHKQALSIWKRPV